MDVVDFRKSLLLALFFASYSAAVGQAIDLSQSIRLKPGMISLDSVLKSASRQAGVVFSFNSTAIELNQTIDVNSGVITLAQLLGELEKRKLRVKIMENYIVLSHGVDRLPPAIKLVSSGKMRSDSLVIAENGIQEQTHRNGGEVIKDSGDYGVNIPANLYDSLFHDQLKETLTKIKSSPRLVDLDNVKPKDKIIVKSKPAVKKAKHKSKPNLFGRFGLSMDETLPLGATAQFGFPALYASASVNTSFASSQFRYGIGTRLKVNEKIFLYLNFNLGNVERTGNVTDTSGVNYAIAVKSKLTRISANVEFSVTRKIKFQVGPMFNYLQTKYFVNSAQDNLQLFGERGDQMFYAIKPPYVLTNTYSRNTDSNIKSWLGLQVNLFYAFSF